MAATATSPRSRCTRRWCLRRWCRGRASRPVRSNTLTQHLCAHAMVHAHQCRCTLPFATCAELCSAFCAVTGGLQRWCYRRWRDLCEHHHRALLKAGLWHLLWPGPCSWARLAGTPDATQRAAGQLRELEAAERERSITPDADVQQLMELLAGRQHPIAAATLFLQVRLTLRCCGCRARSAERGHMWRAVKLQGWQRRCQK